LEIEKARPRLPETVREWCGEVWTCPDCSRLYWEGSHVGSMERLLGEALERARGRAISSSRHISPQRQSETAVARSWDRYDAFLRRLFGEHDRAWSGYRKKRRSLRSKFLSRMGELGLTTLDEYADHVKSHPREGSRLNEILSITVSRFFRDREEWTRLTRRFGDLVRGGKVRAWSLGCASGEEPFTLRILWEEWCETTDRECSLEIYASDVSSICLERARAGLYPEGAVHSIPESLRRKHFRRRPGNLFELDSRVRTSVEFARLDMLEDPWPEGPFDLVMCRNLPFTYLEGETRRRVSLKIVERLREGGILMVGSNEGRRVPGLGLRSLEGCLWERRDVI
jgi:chemotaxis methyl-accepting protein methylase